MKTLKFLTLFLLLSGLVNAETIDTSGQDTLLLKHSLGVDGIAGMNWSDPRDNYADDWLLPTGLAITDHYESVRHKAGNVYTAFSKAGANTVRLPINPSTVSEEWWQAYKGIFDEALDRHMKVIICCWEGKNAKDGKIDDMDAFWTMWDKVIKTYQSNPLVYFEVFNEPFGYSETEWKDIAAEWLKKFPSVPRKRVLVGGRGYCGNVAVIAPDPRFEGCLFSLHIYSWWGDKYQTEAGWQQYLQDAIGPFADCTVITEFGNLMTTGINYTGEINQSTNIAFIQGVTNKMRMAHISGVYWPGLRDVTKDRYTLFKLEGEDMVPTNPSGLERLQIGWGQKDKLNIENGNYD